MNIKIIKIKGKNIADMTNENIEFNNVQDAIDLLGNCSFNGAQSVIISKECITPEFFDLKTGLAGDILQKFSNYQFKLAVVGDFNNIQSKSLNDFIYESNKIGRINFVETIDEAINSLSF